MMQDERSQHRNRAESARCHSHTPLFDLERRKQQEARGRQSSLAKWARVIARNAFALTISRKAD